jgi:hypothetical protein
LSKYLTSWFVLVLVFLVSFAGVVYAGSTSSTCYINVGTTNVCQNTMTASDKRAAFSNVKKEMVYPTDPYEILFSASEWTPSVSRGQPTFRTYWIHDSMLQEDVYVNNDYYNQILNDFGTVSIGPNVYTQYYPGDEPNAVLTIGNDLLDNCGPIPTNPCTVYSQAIVFVVR